MVLGDVDYGLNGLVGGLMVFVSFFNSVLAGANSRFYAFSIGAAKVSVDKAKALEECRHWFNTALSVHTVLPFLLIAIGYPIGAYAIEHWLTIPPDRVDACIWVFRFACISCLVGMVNVPFQAMYGAKQYIAELTIYGFATSTLNVAALFYMVSNPGVWLVKFSAWTCALSVVPQIIICIRACFIFPECKINVRYMWDGRRLRQLGSFSGWQMLGVFCGILRLQGMSIVINKFFGAAMNAAQSIGITVQGHCNTLASSVQGAFVPVITQACGAGDYVKMNKFGLRTCRFNIMLSAVFMIPLALELPEVMVLWLKNPPEFVVGLCYCAMIFHLIDASTVAHCIIVNAVGKIVKYQIAINSVSILTIPLAIVFGLLWRNVYIVMIAQIGIAVITSVQRLFFARTYAGTSICAWLREVFVPLALSISLCAVIGCLPRFFMTASFARVCMTTTFCEVVFIPLIWFVVMSAEEKAFIVTRIAPVLRRLGGRG